MMVMVRFGIVSPAFTTLYDDSMCIMVGHIYQQLRLAGATAIGLIAAAFAGGRSGRMFHHIGAFGLGWGQQDHVELGHGGKPLLFRSGDGESPELSTASFSLPAFAAAVYRSAS